jgi:hypothetical protein
MVRNVQNGKIRILNEVTLEKLNNLQIQSINWIHQIIEAIGLLTAKSNETDTSRERWEMGFGFSLKVEHKVSGWSLSKQFSWNAKGSGASETEESALTHRLIFVDHQDVLKQQETLILYFRHPSSNSFHHCDQNNRQKKLKEGNIYFCSQFCRVQSLVAWHHECWKNLRVPQSHGMEASSPKKSRAEP